MIKRIFILSTFCYSFSCTATIDYQSLIGRVEVYDTIADQPRSHITFVQDVAQNKFVVKQYKYERWPSILATSICELVALDMGHSVGVLLNEACLLPPGVAFIGKELMVPASLHVVVPGVPFSEYRIMPNARYADLDIKQKDENNNPAGLTRELIYQMSRHPHLPRMIALDTYVGNMGRLDHNFFYDELTDSFYGIDMASSFFKNLCEYSYQNILSMLADESIIFSRAEIKALKRYHKTLTKLITLYPPSIIAAQFDRYAEQAGFKDPYFFNTYVQENCMQLLGRRLAIMEKSCKKALPLANALKQLVRKHAPSY